MDETLLNRTIEDWQNALLELGKRNKMISFKSAGTVTIVEPGFEELYEAIVLKDKKLSFQREVDRDIDPRVYSLTSLLRRLEAHIEVTVGDIKVKGLLSNSRRVLKNLRSKAKTVQDEQGLNTLYLVFGFLSWEDAKSAGSKIQSPLLLVPVSLTVESVSAPFCLKRYDDEILVNPALDKYFNDVFNLQLPSFDPDNQTLEDFVDAIEAMIKEKGRFTFSKEVCLGLFSFAKINMYRDLQENEDKIKAHPIIRALIGEENGVTNNEEYFKQFDHDEEHARDTYQVVDADSSQKDAIELSKRGVSFVLQGPPGTGKSQTITNIIAEGLAAKKKILFVSEKMAALDVVYRRLTEVGLADFCLPLHDHKANKKDIIKKIGANLDLTTERIDIADLVKLQNLDEVRKHLKNYVENIHESIQPLDMSIYDVFGEVVGLKDVVDVPLKINNIEKLSKNEMAVLGQEVVKYSKLYKKQGPNWADNPWNGINCDYLSGNAKNRIKDSIEKGINALNIVIDHKLLNKSISDIFTFEEFKNLASILEIIESGIDYQENWQDDAVRDKAKKCVDDVIKRCNHIKQIQEKYNDEIKAIGLFVKDDSIDASIFAKLKYAAEIVPEYELLLGQMNSEEFKSYLSVLEENQDKYFALEHKIQEKCREIGIPEYKWSDLISFVENHSLLLDYLKPCSAWGSNYEEARELLDCLSNTASSLETQKDYLTENYGNSIIDFNVNEILDWVKSHHYDFVKLYNAIIADGKACRELINVQIHQVKSFLTDLQSKTAEIKQVKADIERKRKATGYNWSENDKLEAYCRGSKLAFVSVKPNSCWCNNCDRALKLIGELESLATKIQSEKLDILKTHDKEIFELDCASMLDRFKTDYTGSLFGFSKLFNSQYKDDIKALKRVYKNVKNDLSNEEAVTLLQRLKSYHESIKEYFGKKADVEKYIGVENYDLEYGWAKLKNQISTFVEIAYNFESQEAAYSFLVDKKYNDYLECTARLKELDDWKTNNDGFKLIGQRYKYYETDIVAISNDLYYVEKCLKSLKEQFVPERELDGEKLIELLGRVKAFNRDKNSYYDKAGEAKSLLGVSEYDTTYNWNEIKVQLDCFGELRKIFSNHEKIFRFIASDNKDQIVAISNEFSELNNWEKNSNGVNHIGSYYNKFDTDIAALKFEIEKLRNNSTLFASTSAYISFLKDETRIERVEILNDFHNVLRYQRDWINDHCEDITELLGKNATEKVEVWEDVKQSLEKTDTVMNVMENDIAMALIKSAPEELKSLKEVVANVCDCEANLLAVENLYSGIKEEQDFTYEGVDLRSVAERLQACYDRFIEMDDWIEFRNSRESCIEKGIVGFVDALTEKSDAIENSLKVFEKAFYLAWLERIEPMFSSIFRFNHDEQLGYIDNFSKLDKQQLELARRRIMADLVDDMPVRGSQRGEMDILTKEMYKKAKIMPLRKLFASIPNLLMQLKPCLMMSPLSVAYFLDADKYEFDMVIFDEASQIFPEDAIGAIVRGKQVIIAGDSKQMPPTNFFKAGTSMNDDYDYDDETDDTKFDSILDGADNRLHNCTLRWHYRSLNEDLIAFSNRTIYNGELVTFPATTNRLPDTGVEYVFVENGVYEKQKNINEAKEIVRLVMEHIEKYPNRSLGVIAFSSNQQSAIEDQLDKYRAKHKLSKEQEAFFNENIEEPFFIKNLENVQGDERDTIIFSIGYGKNKAGKMFQRFGPLGRIGGERRLNVAITRAKLNVKLVGSIQANDIDSSDKKAEGVKLLRKYIEFARLGVEALPELEGFSNTKKQDLFVENVAEFLESKGYKVTKGVGSSSYTIDIAVYDPKDENRFIAGIECDGKMYRSAKTVRDRDALRPSVLSRMGWSLYRVWSTAWMKKPVEEKKRLLDFLGYDGPAIEETVISEDIHPDDSVEIVEIDTVDVENARDLSETEDLEESEEIVESGKLEDNLFSATENVTIAKVDDVVATSETNEYGMTKYIVYDISKCPVNSDWRDPYTLGNLIYEIVKVEQPICLYMICQRVAPLLGYSKVNYELIKKVKYAIYKSSLPSLIQDNNSFYIEWSETKVARYSELGKPDRDLEYVPRDELTEILSRILGKEKRLDRTKLNKLVANILGVSKFATEKEKAIITYALAKMHLSGLISFEGKIIRWLED